MLHQRTNETAPPQAAFAPTEDDVLPAAATTQTADERYDTATVQKALTLAQQLQTRHRETLSADELEALGSEIGVEPEFIRRALAQMEAQTKSANEAVPNRYKRVLQRAAKPLTQRQQVIAITPAVSYLLLMPLTFPWVTAYYASVNGRLYLLYLALPLILSFCAGVYGNSKRGGTLAGVLLGLVSMLFVAIIDENGGKPLAHFERFYLLLGVWLGCCAICGLIGATLHHGISRLNSRQLKPERPRFH